MRKAICIALALLMLSSCSFRPATPATAGEVTGEPATVGEVTDEPATVGEVTDEPATAGEVTDEPAAGEVTDEPATVGEVTDEPATAGEVTDEPATAGEVTDEPATAGEVTDEPATAEPEPTIEPEPTEQIRRFYDGEYTPMGFKVEVVGGVTYVGGVLIANKTYSLPESYAPGDLTSDTLAAYYAMYEAAAADGIALRFLCGYRSFYDQQWIYNDYLSRDSKESVDRYSARPGFSEHQTGMAIDLCSLDESFGLTPEGIWLAENCARFGFIIRYDRSKETVTGYKYEPWHIRYIGVPLAEQVASSGLCLEEYLGIDSVYDDQRP